MRDPAVALDSHAREELGIDQAEGLGNPWGAAASSFSMFCLGAVIPLIPFLFAGRQRGRPGRRRDRAPSRSSWWVP